MPLDDIIAEQERWARARLPGHIGRRAPSVDLNLLVPLSGEIRAQFDSASGGELDRKERPGKMRSLRSSSALGVNFFAPWVGRSLTPLARALRVTLSDSTVTFEKQFRHGLGSIPPNVDVVLDTLQDRPLGIESKFTEPYGSRPPHPAINKKYFASGRTRWADLGLPKCQRLASEIGHGEQFHRLGAGQLLKHILGLANSTGRAPRLLCIWFDSGCLEAREHRDELDRFANLIDASMEFSALTYQEAIASLSTAEEPVPGYLAYLRSRYLAA